MSVCQKKGKLILLAGILAGGVMAMGAAPAPATTLSPTITVDPADKRLSLSSDMKRECKTVYITAQSAPTVGVTVGGKRHPIDISAFAAFASVQVCVEIDVKAVVDISAKVKTGDLLCPGVEANVFASASVKGGGIFVRVEGTKENKEVLTVSTEKLHLLPAGTDANVPLDLVVCDP